jgi:transcriptional regulator
MGVISRYNSPGGILMYIPEYFREQDRAEILAFLRQNNFPAIVSMDGDKLVATHTPVQVIEEPNGEMTIYGHISRANPQWRTFGSQEVMLIFQGAHVYISPRWYNHVNVPTWNYMIVHVYGQVRLLQEDELLAFLTRLVHDHEVNTSYSLEGLPQDFVQKEIKGVVGLAVSVTRIDAGYKLSQNRNDRDYDNIVQELDKRGDADSAKVASAMREKRKESIRK